MPLQDLTPELRTRLRQVERTVGWFVALAAIILLAGFGYYIYATAKARGWFVTKLNYATSLDSAAQIHPGDVVTLMGFAAGEVTGIIPNDAEKSYGVTIFFTIRDPYWGYIWYDSKVRVNSDFLGHRSLEVVKGVRGEPSAYKDKATGKLLVMVHLRARDAYTNLLAQLEANANTNLPSDTILQEATNELMGIIKTNRAEFYTNAVRGGYTAAIDKDAHHYYWIAPDEEPALSDRLAAVATSVQMAMPAILGLTNQLGAVLSNANVAVAELQGTLAEARPTLTNLSAITEHLRDPNGSLGNWLLPTNLNAQLNETLVSARETLQSARGTLDSTDTNMTKVATDLDLTLQHLADLTSNLAWQVSVNTNLVSEISTTIIHTDDLVQGLKREWFLRGAFKKKKTETPPATK